MERRGDERAQEPTAPTGTRVRCVGAVIRDAAGRLLLVRRAHSPGAGQWSLPGGRVEPGESDEQALSREVGEETGLRVRVGAVVGTVVRRGPGDVLFDIHDYAATVAGGTLRAGDDADAARWVTRAELERLPLTGGLLDTLTGWGALPRQ